MADLGSGPEADVLSRTIAASQGIAVYVRERYQVGDYRVTCSPAREELDFHFRTKKPDACELT